ncbi:MAG: SRPBCC family protein [Bdellovibrionota bacterium]
MAQAEFHEVMPVDKDKLFATITDYENYPGFVSGVKRAKVENREKGRARVTYHISMIRDVEYTIELEENETEGSVKWELVSSDSFRSNRGFWKLKPVGPGKTEVQYNVELEFTFPAPAFLLSKIVKGSLPAMVKSFVDRANNR